MNEAERIFDEILTPNISTVTLKISQNLSKTQTKKMPPETKNKKIMLGNIMDKLLQTKDKEEILKSIRWGKKIPQYRGKIIRIKAHFTSGLKR